MERQQSDVALRRRSTSDENITSHDAVTNATWHVPLLPCVFDDQQLLQQPGARAPQLNVLCR